MRKKKKRRAKDPVLELIDLTWRVRSLAYLCQLAGGLGDPALEKAFWGLGNILESIGKRLTSVTERLEEKQLMEAKKN